MRDVNAKKIFPVLCKAKIGNYRITATIIDA
jgi:hypothetical protein